MGTDWSFSFKQTLAALAAVSTVSGVGGVAIGQGAEIKEIERSQDKLDNKMIELIGLVRETSSSVSRLAVEIGDVRKDVRQNTGRLDRMDGERSANSRRDLR